MNINWLPFSLDTEKEEGYICGYVTNAKKDVQLDNYMTEQGFPDVVPLIEEKYEMIAILKNMYIQEEERGKGIGTNLLVTFLEKAEEKGAEAVILVADTGDKNEFDLVNWYQKYGFEIVYGKKESYPILCREL